MCALIDQSRHQDRIDGNVRALFTIEDPPERRLIGAQQLVIPNTDSDEKRKMAYADAIRAAMRSDPDGIMVGEVRDDTTADLTLRCSVTGHQVWATIHTSSAHAIPMRLLDLGVERSLIFGSDELFVAAAQVLVPKLCPVCKVHGPDAVKAGHLAHDDADRFGLLFEGSYYVAGSRSSSNCLHCNGHGVKGRTVVAEVIRTDRAYLEMLDRSGMAAARQFCRTRGEPSMADVARRKVQRGEISAVDAARTIDLDELLTQASTSPQAGGAERIAA
jgi:type II secretory ATPase GspE/PulE/Tfp pilus assembly ATPase PilB-like protein